MTTPTILLLSCYELGHQPLSLAWPLAALAAAGVEAAAVDLAVDPFPTDLAAGAQLVAFSVPMHTALRLGVDVAQRVRATNPHAHLCFFGLYAWLNRDYLLDSGLADSLLAGEMEFALVELAQALADGRTADAVAGITTRTRTAGPHLVRQTLLLPQRRTLPELSRYAHYVTSEGAIRKRHAAVCTRAATAP